MGVKMNSEDIANKRNEWIKKVWVEELPVHCVKAGYIPEWAKRAPMWSCSSDFDMEKPIVICGINPGYNPKKQDPHCRLPTGYLPRMVDIDKTDHSIITQSNTHRYFGPYRRLIGENIRFYDNQNNSVLKHGITAMSTSQPFDRESIFRQGKLRL